MPKKSPSKPSTGVGCGTPANRVKATCPLVGFELVDFIEVVNQNEEKLVTGAAEDTTDTAIVKAKVGRKDKDGTTYKQFINLDPMLEGAAKKHPEYGRAITFRARVKQKDGQTDRLAGVKVIFFLTRTDGPNRTNAGGSAPVVWKGADLTAGQKEGFGSPGGAKEASVSTDVNGWTSPVTIYLSEFGGDAFVVGCKLHPSVEGAAGSPEKKTKAPYVVWRRFWYQMTYADSYAPPKPTRAESAYREVFAEMILASEKKFKKTDLPADLQDRTFMPEYQLKQGGGSSKIIANVGAESNIDEFSTNGKLKLDPDKAQPVKENVIVCEFQCDPTGTSMLKKYKLTATLQTITIAVGSGGPIISKPAIKAGTRLVSHGEWSTTATPWAKGGDMNDSDVEIVSTRTSTKQVRIKLPAGAPTPTPSAPVWVMLRLQTADSFLGWAPAGGIVAVYRPGSTAGAAGSAEDFSDTTAHELGHKFTQTPEPANQPASLRDHPLQYVGHGGSGSHCRHKATVAAGAVNWQNAAQKTPSPQDGDCIMYHRYSSKCSHRFCKTCMPYLQLEPMKSL